MEAKDQLYVSGSPLASLLALPSSVTTEPATTFWDGPALATGGAFAAEAVTVTVASDCVKSVSITVSLTEYWPGRSGINVGFTVFGLSITEVLPSGWETIL